MRSSLNLLQAEHPQPSQPFFIGVVLKSSESPMKGHEMLDRALYNRTAAFSMWKKSPIEKNIIQGYKMESVWYSVKHREVCTSQRLTPSQQTPVSFLPPPPLGPPLLSWKEISCPYSSASARAEELLLTTDPHFPKSREWERQGHRWWQGPGWWQDTKETWCSWDPSESKARQQAELTSEGSSALLKLWVSPMGTAAWGSAASAAHFHP